MKDIAYGATATNQLRKLSPAVRARIVAKLQAYAAGGAGDVKRLKGRDGSVIGAPSSPLRRLSRFWRRATAVQFTTDRERRAP